MGNTDAASATRRQANGYKLRTTPGTSRDIIYNNS